jgi:anti-anti-sigma factor
VYLMSLTIGVSVEDGIATLVLTGEADTESAPDLEGTIRDVSRGPLSRLVLDVAGLTYLSSAGLRCLVYAHQRLGRGVRIVLVGANAEVAETIRLTGFDRSITMLDRTGT